MKITKSQLKRIIQEELAALKQGSSATLNEAAAGRVYLEDVVVGQTYATGYRNMTWVSTFLGWECDASGPKMKWRAEDDGSEWEAYMFESKMCVGSSADPLVIFEEV